MRRRTLLLTALLLGTSPFAGEVCAAELARIAGMESREIAVAGFELELERTVEVEATVTRGSEGENRSQVWILDAGTRELAWRPGEMETVERSRFVHRWRESVRLPAGRYELYFAAWSGLGRAGDPSENPSKSSVFESLVRDVVGIATPPKVLAELGAVVRGEGRAVDVAELPRWRAAASPGTVLEIGPLGDRVLEEREVVLPAPATVEIYAVGELSERGFSDWGWLLDADSRQRLWELTWGHSQPGGGWDRNRRARVRLELPAGRYIAGFQTDGGHSAGDWMGSPPFDPEVWGLRLRCISGPGCNEISAHTIEGLPPELEIARITGLGDGERRELSFHLDDSARLWIVALGEASGERMYDHGWIENAATGEPVWRMLPEAVRPAGGAAKNVRVDQVVELAPGDYRAVYETDGSHSAMGGWNATPPFEEERWGLTILAPRSGLVPE